MFDRLTYDSKSLRYKRPYGAVASGGSVDFTLRPPRSEGWSRGRLTAFFEGWNLTRELVMPWAGTELGRDRFSCTLALGDYVGLVWYYFTLERIDGSHQVSDRCQLTVYDDSETVPDWFGAGMTYQIFPDRFCRLSVPDPTGMVGGRTVHSDWSEEPEFRPDARGEIRNRDFFGGSLAGVISKLDYLQSLGVETLYFNPIFEGAENHRYGTADYEKIDPMLGTEEDFVRLCAEAHRRGMRVLLDGVFNHVGFVSKYFNGDGFYPTLGAYQSKESPYYPWFSFSDYPRQYEAWWGIYSLPAVRESEPSYVDYIVRGANSIVRRWLRAGADGWRLDVADELPDAFVEQLHAVVRAEKPEAVVIGEVWEDGSSKIAYGVRRKHILGRHCDGLMNYPFRNALLAWLMGGDASAFREEMEALRENYPRFAFYSAMNALGTHDTPRVLTLLGTNGAGCDQSKDWKSVQRLTPEQRALGLARLKLGFLVLFAFPGSPTVYYGDEAGMEGYEDPFNRRTYPWGRDDRVLRDWVAQLGRLRRSSPALRKGELDFWAADGPLLSFRRRTAEQETLLCANNSDAPARLPLPAGEWTLSLGAGELIREGGALRLTLPPMGGALLSRGSVSGACQRPNPVI